MLGRSKRDFQPSDPFKARAESASTPDGDKPWPASPSQVTKPKVPAPATPRATKRQDEEPSDPYKARAESASGSTGSPRWPTSTPRFTRPKVPVPGPRAPKEPEEEPSDPFKARAESGLQPTTLKRWLTAGPEAGDKPRVPMATFDRLGQTLVATITVDALAGHQAIGLAAEILDRIIVEGESGGVRHVVFDVQNVQYMDSTCVGVFVELLGKLQEAGGRIALVNADQNVEYLFKLTRLDRLFPICRDVMRAIDAVERGR